MNKTDRQKGEKNKNKNDYINIFLHFPTNNLWQSLSLPFKYLQFQFFPPIFCLSIYLANEMYTRL